MTAQLLDVRADFPFLDSNDPLVYFDNAATTQKPRAVLDALQELYSSGVANVHRAGNFLAHAVTERFEQSRLDIATFMGAEPHEVVLVSNATHGLNLLGSALARNRRLRVLAATLEHHSNFLPWLEHGAIEPVPWTPAGDIDLNVLDERLRTKPDLLAVTYASNFLGTLQPVRTIIELAHRSGVPVVVDASQAVAHIPINVRDLDCDYLVFSGHKVYGPSGTGALFVRNDHQSHIRPLFVGGGMVKEVRHDGYALNDIPLRYEAGTPNIEGVIGLAAALRYLESIDFNAITAHETRLTEYARTCLGGLPNTAILGPANGQPSAPVISFRIPRLESSAVEKVLAARGRIVVRSGFHCAQPAHDTLGIGPTVRVSFGLYNTTAEIDRMIGILTSLTGYLD